MKRLLLKGGLAAFCLLTANCLALGQTKVIYRDAAKKTTESTGTIKSESAKEVVVKPNIGVERKIPAPDVIDIVYELKAELRPDYRKATTAETVSAIKMPPGSPQRRTEFAAAKGIYEQLIPKLAADPNAQRHMQFKSAYLQAQIASDQKEKQSAIDLLEAYRKKHPQSWQIHLTVGTLADLYKEVNQFDKAASTYREVLNMGGLPPETVADLEMRIALLLVRAKKHDEAAKQLESILKTMQPTNPQYKQLRNTLIMCKANSPTKFKEAIDELRKTISLSKDKTEIAQAYNTLGDCYMLNNQPKDAVYEYLYVDLIYNQDRTEHLRAITALVQVFGELRLGDRSKEYAERLEKMTK